MYTAISFATMFSCYEDFGLWYVSYFQHISVGSTMLRGLSTCRLDTIGLISPAANSRFCLCNPKRNSI